MVVPGVIVRRLPASRVPSVPLWALGVVALWGAGLLAIEWLAGAPAPGEAGAIPGGPGASGEVVTCQFRRLTGVPCPTCGSTRAVTALATGDVAGAVALNPLVVLVLVAAAFLLVRRWCTRTRLVLELDRPRKHIAVALVATAMVVNWVWVMANADSV